MDTEEDTMARLHAQGYEHEFSVTPDGAIACPECGEVVDPAQVQVDNTVRFEGPSDPEYSSAVFALSSGPCGHRGVLVTAFGPSAEGPEADAVARLGTGEPAAPPDDPITAREAAEQVLIEEGDSAAGTDLGDQID